MTFYLSFCRAQDEPLQLRVFDYDAFSADDQIGTVYVHCNSLYEDFDDDCESQGQVGTNRIEKERDARQLHGWFPIYDTMRGLCGELQVTVYIQHIMDFNPVEDSSIGVQVLCSSTVPEGYVIRELLGLVDELLVERDPEHIWQDNFRSSRSSNEARQLLLLTMDGKLRRQIGRKVTDLGGNVVLAYQTNLDFEDEFIIARGHGEIPLLACVEIQHPPAPHPPAPHPAQTLPCLGGSPCWLRMLQILSSFPHRQAFYLLDLTGTAARVELMIETEDREANASIEAAAGDQERLVSSLASRVAKAFPKSVTSAVSAVANAVSTPSSPNHLSSPKPASGEAVSSALGEAVSSSPPAAIINSDVHGSDVCRLMNSDVHGSVHNSDVHGSGSQEPAHIPKELSALPQNQLRTLHRTNRDDVRANLRMGEVQLLSLQVCRMLPQPSPKAEFVMHCNAFRGILL